MADSVKRATIQCLDTGLLSFDVPFNPTNFKLVRRNNWADLGAHGQPWGTLQYSHGSSDTLEMTLLLDTSEEEDSIQGWIRHFLALTYPMQVGSEEGNARPACVVFSWDETRFQGVVQSLEIDVNLFASDGEPKRALVKVTLLGRALGDAMSAADFFGQTYEPPTPLEASAKFYLDDLRLSLLDD